MINVDFSRLLHGLGNFLFIADLPYGEGLLRTVREDGAAAHVDLPRDGADDADFAGRIRGRGRDFRIVGFFEGELAFDIVEKIRVKRFLQRDGIEHPCFSCVQNSLKIGVRQIRDLVDEILFGGGEEWNLAAG